ncbi:MAG: hypothetical protein K0U74_16650 [Alphaproteobacteria bacterium]|nr:hypothetical protein [Alphaproteobacteria bacterium]
MAKAPIDIRSLARAHTKKSIEVLGGIVSNGKRDSDRIAAATALLDRGWGKPKQELSIERKRTYAELTNDELEAIARGEADSGEGATSAEDGPRQSDSVH